MSGNLPGLDIKVLPPDILKAGKEVIDDVTFEFDKVGPAEGSFHLLIRIPQLQTLIAQDLVYNGVHPYIGQNQVDSWINTLNSLKAQNNSTLILTGHGKPADPSVYGRLIAYLTDFKQIYAVAKNGDEVKQQLLQKYPDYLGSRLLDISLPRLYTPK